MNRPLVTVAIPSYNHAKYISQTIQSILDQTFQDFEILIIDDASSDNTLEVVKSFCDSRIKLTILKKNSGVCKTSNLCIANALGEYIAIIASDDMMEKTKLEKQVSFLQNNPKYSAVFSGMEVIDENGIKQKKKTKKYTKIFEKENRDRFEWLRFFFSNGNCIAAPSMLAKTSALKEVGGFNSSLTQAHDFDLWVKLCLKGHEIYIIGEKLLKYRERNYNKNLSSNTKNTRIRLLFDNEKILRNFLEVSSLKDFRKIFPDSYKDNLQFRLPEHEKIIIDYLIFQEAYKHNLSIYHKQFATDLIFEILQKADSYEILAQNFGFSFAEYGKIITQNPLGVLLEEMNYPISRKFFKFLAKLLTH